MTHVQIHNQVHGYRQGHQLLSASVALEVRDQDAVDRLSDLAGPLRPGELFDPYLTAYPLPSEKYYVLARTFQDLATARSGCVRTNSLLMPMAAWDKIESLDGVLAALVCPDPNTTAVAREISAATCEPPARVTDRRMAQLVDAVFLDRRPVVFFDCAESEAIAIRLFLALWPAARRRFSLCTFALGPRSLVNRFFDLVFAPLSAKSRFAGLDHRRLGASEQPAYGRDDNDYSWAEPAALHIFQSDDPSLTGLDPLRLLSLEERGDRTSLRVVSLWNELASRANGNPTAVLGMLDILRSRKAKHLDASWPDLEATVLRAIGAAETRLPVEAAWEFLFALEAKIAGGWVSPMVQQRIEAGAGRLAARDIKAAFAALAEDPMRRIASIPVAKGLAEEAAASPEFSHLVHDIAILPPVAVAQLMGLSPRFVRRVVEGVNVDQDLWIDVFLGAFDAADEDLRPEIRRLALSVVEDHVVERTVPHVLADVTGGELTELVRYVIDGRSSALSVLNGALWDAARTTGCEALVRDAVMESSAEANAEQFVLPTLVLNKADVEWLARRTRDERRAHRLLRALLGTAGDEAIKALPRSTAVDVLALLGTDVQAGKHEIVEILALDLVRDEAAFDLGVRTLSVLSGEDARVELGEWVARAGLSVARADDERLGGVLAEFGSSLAASDLVEAATSNRASTARVAANLVALDASRPDVREKALDKVEQLSKRLVGRPRQDLGRNAYTAWASIIRDSVRVTGTDAQLRTAKSVLRFALRSAKMAVSALILETFPVVYKSLPKTGRDRKRGGSGSVFSPRYLWWMGLDEPANSRKRAINELVRAFMNSTWPPADLILTALKAGVAKKVVKRIREQPRGMRYIDDIRDDANRLQKSTHVRVIRCLEGGH